MTAPPIPLEWTRYRAAIRGELARAQRERDRLDLVIRYLKTRLR